jgi:hypothetical protein
MFSSILLQPSFGAALGVVLIFVFVAIFWTFDNGRQLADVNVPAKTESLVSMPNVQPSSQISAVTVASNEPKPEVRNERDSYKIETAVYRPERRVSNRPENIKTNTRPVAPAYLPAEESYVKTIDGLKRNIDNKDTMMPASSRVSYERDMAIVDDTIVKMKKAVNTNPKNEAAKQALYASYQDKIDLLNSAAQREELMASIR